VDTKTLVKIRSKLTKVHSELDEFFLHFLQDFLLGVFFLMCKYLGKGRQNWMKFGMAVALVVDMNVKPFIS
jgi:hypothetical protein